LKFLQPLREAGTGTSNSKPHWNRKVARAPLFPKFAMNVLRT
jgi:hypothetical protein